MEEVLTGFDFPKEQPAIIKVIGVGGGGGNAVTHMYKEGIADVTFALCNTDNQALIKSDIPIKVQLGKTITNGLGSGNRPEIAKQAAEESIPDIQRLLSDETKMVLITAGMGGGTGTGAAPVIAKVAKEMDILTVGIVTIPFLFEKIPKILQALKGVEEMKKNVDALLVINNERLREIYSDLDIINGFKKADDILNIAAKSIAEIITITGIINLDFADVNSTLKEGGVAIMSAGFGEGENRVAQAFESALNSPLLNNNNAFNSKKILFNIYFSSQKPLMMPEMDDVNDFMARFNRNIEVIWGTAIDESLNEKIKVTILATGFNTENIVSFEIRNAQKVLDEEEELIKIKTQQEEDEKNSRLLEIYYPGWKTTIGKPTKPKPFIFKSIQQMDDDETINALINHPTYNRNANVMIDIVKKAESRRQGE
ncbi:MAG: cell division protein FtsZ [Dysgonamonadaceae bacterium]|jgi:cell division protein FtsZ|nr:cell division protein FtsZ [Dysgonamonadaceae bacterium]